MANDAARIIRLLLATRFVRSIGQGALAVGFALYLRALDWSAVAISAVLSAALITGVVLTLVAGPLSDRGGRRRFLFAYEAAQTLAGMAALLSAEPILLGAAAMVGGFGRGGNGGAGPFGPVEQAWLAQAVAPMRRGPVYSLNAALGFLGNAVVPSSPPPRPACTRSCPVRSPIDRSSFSRPPGHCCAALSFFGRRIARQGNLQSPSDQTPATASNGAKTDWSCAS
jgi:hypothetical protein